MFSVFKSAVAFFFLFFLHEISIENGHKGISYNVSVLYDVAGFQQKTQYEAPQFELVKMFNRST